MAEGHAEVVLGAGTKPLIHEECGMSERWETIHIDPEYWQGMNRGHYAHITFQERRRCHGRGHGEIGPGILVQRNGVKQVANHCLVCGAKQGGAIKLEGHDLNDLPVFRDNRGQHCWEHTLEPARVIDSDGRTRYVMACLSCNQQDATQSPDKGDLFCDTWPVLQDHRFDQDGHIVTPPCEHCGSRSGTQLHHWAPRSMFADADRWPQSYLCPPCHRMWHSTVTPAITRRQPA